MSGQGSSVGPWTYRSRFPCRRKLRTWTGSDTGDPEIPDWTREQDRDPIGSRLNDDVGPTGEVPDVDKWVPHGLVGKNLLDVSLSEFLKDSRRLYDSVVIRQCQVTFVTTVTTPVYLLSLSRSRGRVTTCVTHCGFFSKIILLCQILLL